MRTLKVIPGAAPPGKKTFGIMWPGRWSSQEGISRSAPSSQPMYQSGWTA